MIAMRAPSAAFAAKLRAIDFRRFGRELDRGTDASWARYTPRQRPLESLACLQVDDRVGADAAGFIRDSDVEFLDGAIAAFGGFHQPQFNECELGGERASKEAYRPAARCLRRLSSDLGFCDDAATGGERESQEQGDQSPHMGPSFFVVSRG